SYRPIQTFKFSDLFAGRGNNLLCRVLHGFADLEIQSGILQDLATLLHVRAFETEHHGQLDVGDLRGFDNPVRQRVDAQDAAEDVDEHRLHVLVAQQDLEGAGDLLGVGSAADIQEVCRRSTRKLDDVHGGHRQAGAVHHAGDVAVELDVVQPVFRRFDLERIF